MNATAPSPATSTRPAPQPGFARRAPRNLRPLHLLLIAGLALLFVLQWLLADRERLAADARWRPVVAGLCAALPCSVPAWHEPSALRMIERDIRADPARPGLLRVQARFRNDARWPQAWPHLQLSLADADGRRLAARVLQPAEYLGEPPSAGERLAAGQEAAIAFDIVEPPGGVVAFSFAFH
ncbi:MAG: DUF3426 domain-containing protein [Pseudoxanthomonas suwonensis]|nr:DUF3426 domain-containing protein [Pseudoxanthomonas suwonensis]